MERAGRLIGKLKLSREINDPETRARAAWKLGGGEENRRAYARHGAGARSLMVEVGDYVWQRQLAYTRTVLLRILRRRWASRW